MRQAILIALLLVAAAAPVAAQISGFYGVGASLPATCFTSQTFFLTSAAAGANWYGCTSTNTWTVMSGSGGTAPAIGGTITGGTINNILFVNPGATFAQIAAVNSAVLVTNGSGVPSESTTLPSGLTIPSPAFTGTASGGNLVIASSPGAGIAHFAGSTQAVTSSAVVSADLNITTTTCTNQFVRAITSSAGGTCQSVAAADLPNINVLISTSGPVTDPGNSADYQFNNGSGALTFNLPDGVAGLQRCYRNQTGKTGAITIAVTTSNAIDLNGANGTTSTGTLVSGGALGDAVCLVSDAAHHWHAYVQRGTWTNN